MAPTSSRLRWTICKRSEPPFLQHTFVISCYANEVDINPAARKHGVADEDIMHATRHALVITRQPADDTLLYIGPDSSAALLEVVTIARDDGSESIIHAMPLRNKYLYLLEGGSAP